MSRVDTVVMCSAGVGSRLGLHKPKCLVEIEGRPIVHWQLDFLKNIENFVMVIGYRADDVIDTVRAVRPDTKFVLNNDYLTTTVYDSLRIGVEHLNEPFMYLDGDLLVTQTSIDAILNSDCPAIGVKRTYTEQPLCVDVEDQRAVGFTREVRPYEWTGMALMNPEHVRSVGNLTYIYQVFEHYLPTGVVEIECFEVDTIQDFEEARIWMQNQLALETSGSKEGRRSRIRNWQPDFALTMQQTTI